MNKGTVKRYASYARETLLGCMTKEAANGWFDRLLVLGAMEARGYLAVPLSVENIKAGKLDGAVRGFFSGFPKDVPAELEELIFRMREISRDDWARVETVGWLYQYYMTEEREAVVDPLYGKAYTKEDIPAATQVFTPEWLVKYITDNSLGKLLAEKKRTLEEIKVIDPCVGAGHFLSYAFDLLLSAYLERGESEKAAAEKIVKYNLYGLDIDDRVCRLARFTVLMKAKACGADSEGLCPNVYAIPEYGCRETGDREYAKLLDFMRDAKEYGSILKIEGVDLASLREKMPDNETVRVACMLADSYDAVLTNPPYMNKYSPKLKAYIQKHYNDYKGDLFSVFIYRCLTFCRPTGFVGMVTPNVWMFIKKHEALRRHIIEKRHIVTLLQLAKGSFFSEATVDLCAFVLESQPRDEAGVYYRLDGFRGDMALQEEKLREALADPACPYRYETKASRFASIPGAPIAYFVSEALLSAFASGTPLGETALCRNGMKTGDNDRFVRMRWEVAGDSICSDAQSVEEAVSSGKRWFPYNKGGEYRKWYGNDEFIVNWENGGSTVMGEARADGRNVQDYPDSLKFSPAVTWSLVTSGKPSFRLKTCHISDIAGMSFYPEGDGLYYTLGFCNSAVAYEILSSIAPTVNFQAGDIARLPLLYDEKQAQRVVECVKDSLSLARADWDAFEISADFKKHPLIG